MALCTILTQTLSNHKKRNGSLGRPVEAYQCSRAYQQTPAGDIGDDSKIPGRSNLTGPGCSLQCLLLLAEHVSCDPLSLGEAR